MRARALGAMIGFCVFGGEASAHAQACCASTSTLFPARLQDTEDGLVGLAAKAAVVTGSYDKDRVYAAQPAGASEWDFSQALLVTARMFEQLQFNVAIPLVETTRRASTTSDAGAGLGDVAFALRWDAFRAGEDPVVPGIAPFVALSVPSGTPVESARGPLGADATGLGSAQATTGIALEQVFGRALFVLSGAAMFHGARTAAGVHSQLGTDLSGTIGASYTFQRGISLGASLTYTGSFDSNVAGQDIASSGRAFTQIAASLVVPLPRDMRVQGAIFFLPPMSSLGQNENASVGLSLTLAYGFVDRRCCGCTGGMCPPRH